MNPITRQRRNAATRKRALAIANSQVGVKEQPPGSNRGPKVDAYLAAAGLRGQAQPWCAAFVTWVYREAGCTFRGWNLAYCPSFVREGRNGDMLRTVLASNVMPGDLALFDWGHDGVADHIGIVTSRVDRAGTFRTVEGNTSTGSAGSQSNGGCVAARTRSKRDVVAFLRVVPS